MAFGTLKSSQARHAIPLCSSPYPVEVDEFSDIDMLTIQYYTTYDAVKDLIPEQFELEEEPLVTLSLIRYGFSPIGAYTEFVSQVEVIWQGQKNNFSIELILDNEGAIFAGRERWGIPKVFGNVVWDPRNTKPVPPGYITGHAERPIGSKLVQFGFKPQRKLQEWGPLDRPKSETIHLRCIPAPNAHDPPTVREIIPTWFQVTHAETWTGEGSIGLFDVSAFDPIHKLKAVRYAGAVMLRNARAILHPVTKTYPF